MESMVEQHDLNFLWQRCQGTHSESTLPVSPGTVIYLSFGCIYKAL